MTEAENAMVDIVVCGRSLPALQSALDFVEVGFSVIVTESIGSEAHPAAPQRDPEGTLSAFMHRVAQPLDDADGAELSGALPISQQHESPLLRDPSGQWAPQSEPNVLGVPAVVLASKTMRLLGAGAAARAYLDRITPLLTVGKTREFGRLVRKRLGATTLQRLVEPQVFERFGRDADQVEVAIAAPGLNEALTRAGALSSAVLAYSDRNEARETRVIPNAGWEFLHSTLLRRLELYGVLFADSLPANVQNFGQGWAVQLQDGTQLRSRAVVVDQGSSTSVIEAFGDLLRQAQTQSVRVHASIDIEAPEWLQGTRSAVAIENGWAVRVDLTEATPRASFISSVVDAGSPQTETLRDEPEALLNVFSLRPTAEASWKFTEVAAPFSTLAERELAHESIEQIISEQDTLLPAGSAFYGGDEGAALNGAHRAAVALRRRLLGLEIEND